MPSIIPTTITSLILLSSLLLPTAAAPAPSRWQLAKAVIHPDVLSSYSAPLTNGKTALPTPSPMTLKAIALGRGSQNYTCASSTAADAPVSVGAVATLIDAGAMLPYVSSAKEGLKLLNELPSILLDIDRSAIDKSSISKAGVHYFNADGAPVFDLSKSGKGKLIASKIGNITAPATATKGPNGAVDWLALDAKAGAGSHGLARVYRTTTASGQAPKTCKGLGKTIEVQYAAQYFFYD